MKENNTQTPIDLNTYYNNVYIPIEFLELLEAMNILKENMGPNINNIVLRCNQALAKTTQPN